MSRSKKQQPEMPPELWVVREPRIEFLTWDEEPFLPKGETATRYVRADIADAAAAEAEILKDELREALERLED